MNPGPKSDENVEKSLNAIKQNNDGILEVNHEVKGIRDEVSMLRHDITQIQDSVQKVESVQNGMNIRLDKLEKSVYNVQYDQDVLASDMASISFHHER